MYYFLVPATVLFCTLIAPVLPAEAQGYSNLPCAERDKVLLDLVSKYKEAPSAIGITNGGGLIELLMTKDGSTWTIIVTKPDGTSCLVAAGTDWTPVPYKPQERRI